MKKEVRDALEAKRRFRILNFLLSASKISAQLQDFGIPKSYASGEHGPCRMIIVSPASQRNPW